MPETKAQKETVARVMHEWKHGELKGPNGADIKDPKRAIAIGLSEAGASNRLTPKQNRHNLAHTQANEREVRTGRQEKEGKAPTFRSRSELYAQARERDIAGRSKMSKAQLEKALAE